MSEIREGQTATSKDGKSRVVYRSGMWVKDTAYSPPAEKAKTATQDRTALNAASETARVERDALRMYSGAQQAVDAMGTGPVRNAYLDAIIPDDDDGLAGKIGAFVGTPLRALVSQKTLDARDHLKTLSANVQLAGSQMMKGSSSDKDTAIMRMAGLSPSKQPAENRRILREAQSKGALNQLRATVTANWIGRFGSLSATSPNGMTFEQNLQYAEQRFAERQRAHTLPKAPPRARSRGVTTIDLDGNPIQ